MLDCIWMGFAELSGTGREGKFHNENICLQRNSNNQPYLPYPMIIKHTSTPTEMLNGLFKSYTIMAYE